MENQAKRFARVVIPSPLKQPLIYAVPPDLQDEILVGMRALIPLGRRKVVGIVFELLPETHLIETKQILAVLDEQPILDAALIQLSLWIAQYYLATIGEVLATILPPSLRSESQRTVVAKSGTFSISDAVANKILHMLGHKKGRISIKTLMRQISGGNVYQALERLESFGDRKGFDSTPTLRLLRLSRGTS